MTTVRARGWVEQTSPMTPDHHQQHAVAAPPRAARVSLRAVVVGAVLVAGWAAISPYSDHYTGLTWGFGWGSLPVGPVALAFLLVVVNTLVARLLPRWALTGAEVLIAYSMLTVAAAIVIATTPYMLPIGAYAPYHARIEPSWEHTVLPYLPPWLHPAHPELIPWFWEGLPEGARLPWRDWVTPVLGWGSFAVALLAAMLCLGALMRKDWIERQRLTFPLTEIPLGLVGERPLPTLGGSVFRERILWIGFLIAATLTALVWINQFVPAVPAPVLVRRVGQVFDGAGLPLSALSDVMVRVQPATIGIMCLVPVDVCFSLWAFYALFMLYLVGCGTLGIPPQGSAATGGFNPRAFADYAGSGGFIVVSAMALYQSRGALRAGLRSLFGRGAEEHDAWAPMTNRAALVGFLLANAFMLWWALRAGMSWWSFALFMALAYVAMIGTSRLVAAAGLIQARPAVNPRFTVLRTLGAQSLDPRSLVMYGYLTQGYLLEPQNYGIVYLMNAFKLLHTGRIRGRGFPTAAMIAVIAALLAGSAALLYTTYRYGAVTMECWPITAVSTCVFREFTSSLASPEQANGLLRLAVVVGALFTLGLFWMTSRFVWWPLTPIGFIVASVWHTNQHVWTNALIAWVLVSTIRRYGGLRLYRTLRPAFIGLVLGQYLTDAAMALLAGALFGARGMSSVSR
jgi:hypothetical protein